jgi:hypothetical protein
MMFACAICFVCASEIKSLGHRQLWFETRMLCGDENKFWESLSQLARGAGDDHIEHSATSAQRVDHLERRCVISYRAATNSSTKKTAVLAISAQ